ncbi:MAG: succinate--CoA ligase subunit beta [Bdellovibrionales bacterium RIFOXYD12_FULL_39_22]|nr:MAG: succinate--CoA ligase subunit beta [Bdellovibrionales bacterium RIFOXYB1_FULL_39_21]OFZ42708.1 MAG: succinate--CoA ligase subunit beta [Bdellovibrionales bacterium RIFOXYC12_FULL_39_17]OFZ47267.1 MAG: succinate--CoA ligase subunit beta [Bdellovibrionales bacterium RIFOXYC1_FULL_39_130]OFZ75433.1 MAG: succinate--CoA ligase subunit beta [Bdellovibrionales bacterium RIFOXYD1_FULL_39_84]OFZ93387.1 MAG: succinate--CoA ligase subunit beta [Bdellovibrionales bacterium RIFOXYD12_FULL_39_22]HLE
MNIHEFQAKELMRKFGITTLNGGVTTTVNGAVEVAKKLGGKVWVVKAQIHAGGRGKAGGVKLAKSLDEVLEHAKNILGKTLITHQTGPEGKEVKTLLIEEGCGIEHEYYVGLVMDRSKGKITFMASAEGGVEIEKVAAATPEKIIKVSIDPAVGYSPYVGRKLAFGIGLKGDLVKKAEKFFENLYKLYIACDCTIAEINPLVTTTDGNVLALDAKLNFDDNALFKHPEIEAYRDSNEESKLEMEAHEFGLSYIALDGNIGCLVNGAGLAMATMDIIKLHGGTPANFLDVGGGATKEAVEKAFSIILTDPKVKAILVNIFGGIMKCDVIADGIIAAAKSLGVKVPLVVRLEGTNVALGKKMLKDSGYEIIAANDLGDAAKKVVEAAKSKI